MIDPERIRKLVPAVIIVDDRIVFRDAKRAVLERNFKQTVHEL